MKKKEYMGREKEERKTRIYWKTTKRRSSMRRKRREK